MKLINITKGIKKYHLALEKLSKKENLSLLYLYADCLWSYIRYGCVLNQYIDGKFYLKKNFERKKILTYKKWEKIISLNNSNYSHFLKNKIDFNTYFKEFVGRDWLYSKQCSYEDFLLFFKKYKDIFIKPIDGLEGDGCQILNYTEGKDYRPVFDSITKNRYIIEEKIIQHSSLVFNNKSVNTIRIYTVYDKSQCKAFCISATLRVGVGDCIVDNSHSGGIAYEIDLETGIIDSKGWGHDYSDVLFHPGNTTPMLGFKIPFWECVLDICIKAAQMIPNVLFIGWDVAITENGPILVEGNHTPDLDIMEFVGHYGYYYNIKSHLKNSLL